MPKLCESVHLAQNNKDKDVAKKLEKLKIARSVYTMDTVYYNTMPKDTLRKEIVKLFGDFAKSTEYRLEKNGTEIISIQNNGYDFIAMLGDNVGCLYAKKVGELDNLFGFGVMYRTTKAQETFERYKKLVKSYGRKLR